MPSRTSCPSGSSSASPSPARSSTGRKLVLADEPTSNLDDEAVPPWSTCCSDATRRQGASLVDRDPRLPPEVADRDGARAVRAAPSRLSHESRRTGLELSARAAARHAAQRAAAGTRRGNDRLRLHRRPADRRAPRTATRVASTSSSGAKGSPMQLILAGIYHLDAPTGNIPLAAAQELGAESADQAGRSRFRSATAFAASGSSARRRITSTSTAASSRRATVERQDGGGARRDGRRAHGLGVGDRFAGSHGLAEGGAGARGLASTRSSAC